MVRRTGLKQVSSWQNLVFRHGKSAFQPNLFTDHSGSTQDNIKMKKQTNLTIKAHLIRGAFYLLLLTAVCAIPFALAQRNTTKRGVANPASKPSMVAKFAAGPAGGAAQATKLSGVRSIVALQGASQSNAGSRRLLPYDVRGVPNLPRMSEFPQTASGVGGAHILPIPRAPKAPQVVLYDQYDNASANATSSQDFEAAFDPFDDQLADDFVVPGGQTWNVESIDADGIPFNCSGSCVPDTFNVFFYADSGGLPGAQVYSATGQSFVIAGSTYSITLTVPAVLGAGTYWVSVQARMDFTGNGQWGWTDRTVQSNQGAAWQNPGGGFGVCPTWTRKPTCIPTAGGPDQVFRLNGTTGGGGSPTPTATATPTGTPGGCVINGSIDTGDPTQTDRLFRSGIPQTCPASTTCAIFGDPTPRHYDSYTFTNTTGASQCVTVDTNTACTGTNFVFIGAYLGSFDPANICTNWIGDSGSSPNPDQPFSFNVDDGQTFVVVVSEVTPDAGCPGYTLTVTPATICGGGGTPTPTATATATPTGSPTCIPGGTPGPWTAGNVYPLNIVRYGFAQTATHFYVFGGVADGTRVNNVNRMDLASGTWQSRAPMPFTSEAPTCALDASSGIVYCAEGDTGSGFASYNIATDTWSSLASIPAGDHYGSASGAFNGKVFVAGGTTSFSNAVQVYDVASNTWSAGTSVPSGTLLSGYQQVGQFLYIVGGWTGGAPTGLTTTYRLDMSSAPGAWDTGPAFTMGRADFGLAIRCGSEQVVCAWWGSAK